MLITAVLVALATSATATPAPFLIFHVDAVSRHDFDAALAAGRLPNIEAAFTDGAYLPAVTLYFAATPVIYPRMRDPEGSGGPGRVGFGGFDRDLGRPVTEAEVFLELLEAVPRRAVTNFVHGIPGLDALAVAAMQNLPALLERYGVIEFFWFSTDALGHLAGAQAHAASLERFDAALGRILPELDLERLNLILYTDHGITFATEMVDQDAIVHERIGDQVLHFDYPNLYLHDPAQAPSAARALATADGFDTSFYRLDATTVEGFVDGAFVRFERVGDGLRYVSAEDPLGYAALGYRGEALDPDAWLSLTVDARFPGTPWNVWWYLDNPDTGDVVVSFTPPRIPRTTRATQGAHAGIVDTDLSVVVLARGPDLETLMTREAIWLHELYLDAPAALERRAPARDEHIASLSLDLASLTPAAELRWSPAYRQRLAIALTPQAASGWAEVDLFSTYLARWWLGGGLSLDDERGLEPLFHSDLHLDLGPAQLTLSGRALPTDWSLGVSLRIALEGGWGVRWQAPAALGVEYRW